MMRLFELSDRMGMNTSVFNFGSMRDDRIFKIVLGRTVSKENREKAYIKGYKAVKVEGELYPVLIKSPGTITEGELVHNLTPKDLERIEHYEAGEYGTEVMPVFTKRNDEQKLAQVYVNYNDKIKPIEDQEWNFKEFQKSIEDGYIDDTKKWMENFEDE